MAENCSPLECLRNNIVIKWKGEKIADGAINVCLRGTAKEFNYTRRIFLPLLLENGIAKGEENWLFGRARGEFHFPRENDGPPAAVNGSREQKKKGSACVHVTCVARHDFARGNKIYLFNAVRRDAMRIIANSRPRTLGWDSQTAKSGTVIDNSFICNAAVYSTFLNIWFLCIVKFKLCYNGTFKEAYNLF